ncbi:hypothetical protein [Limnobacter sp. SAORIC-690]|uniref:hypothetical protein n=1 Tax=Limnobacter sp. SAORIC-690 TaxID=1923970 RepID=UPI0011AFE6A9|nr:hypothetical protein [Limnobacter sp. SAORIC-690]
MQEALTNAARHANTKKLKVLAGFDEQAHEFILIVENDGVASSAAVNPSLGLTGIRERMAILQGHVVWAIEEDRFMLRCHIPVVEVNHAP